MKPNQTKKGKLVNILVNLITDWRFRNDASHLKSGFAFCCRYIGCLQFGMVSCLEGCVTSCKKIMAASKADVALLRCHLRVNIKTLCCNAKVYGILILVN